jgi:SAM-dependent methyltransferase
MMKNRSNDEIRKAVRKTYADIAKGGTNCCDPSDGQGDGPGGAQGCCTTPEQISVTLGYSDEEVNSVPEGANMGLGCGNPQAIAALKQGETVVDLGSGGGFDCFLAAKAVGDTGLVIGVDMTPDMISKARVNAEKAGYSNVEFRLGEIEHLPVADNSVDALISNCVINLSPDKPQVYRDAFRILKKGGRIAVSDIVALQELPEDIKNDIELHAGCVAGAAQIDELKAILEEVGFTNISITLKEGSKEILDQWMPGRNLGEYIASASIEACK